MEIVKSQAGIISPDSQDPRILEICKKARRRPCHWTIYQELCQLIIRAVQSLLCWILKMWRSLIQRPRKCYRNYLINCRDLLNVYLDSKGKHQMKITDAYVWYQSKWLAQETLWSSSQGIQRLLKVLGTYKSRWLFVNANCIHRKISCYQVAMVTLFWPQKRKLNAKQFKSLTCSLLPHLD